VVDAGDRQKVRFSVYDWKTRLSEAYFILSQNTNEFQIQISFWHNSCYYLMK
jgi:hypothetical protein